MLRSLAHAFVADPFATYAPATDVTLSLHGCSRYRDAFTADAFAVDASANGVAFVAAHLSLHNLGGAVGFLGRPPVGDQ